jgi:hypothetical protein
MGPDLRRCSSVYQFRHLQRVLATSALQRLPSPNLTHWSAGSLVATLPERLRGKISATIAASTTSASNATAINLSRFQPLDSRYTK